MREISLSFNHNVTLNLWILGLAIKSLEDFERFLNVFNALAKGSVASPIVEGGDLDESRKARKKFIVSRLRWIEKIAGMKGKTIERRGAWKVIIWEAKKGQAMD